jgi:hypothetical protein
VVNTWALRQAQEAETKKQATGPDFSDRSYASGPSSSARNDGAPDQIFARPCSLRFLPYAVGDTLRAGQWKKVGP